MRLKTAALVAALICLTPSIAPATPFDLQFVISDPGSFTANQLAILNDSLAHVENMWETVLMGYNPGVSIPAVTMYVQATYSGLASANFSGTSFQGGFTYSTSGFININVNEIENFANWQGVPGPPTYKPPTNLNYIDELLAHETGHALGIGTLWTANGLYVFGSYQYTGVNAVNAYKAEFDPAATFMPVEDAGNIGTPNAHWDQRMRSSLQEGNPADPWSLDPRVGVVDQYGRDRGLEMMTGAIDPDYLEPFISRTTVQSMRDLGYTVAEFEDFNGDGSVTLADLTILQTNFNSTGLQIDSMAFGDADRDRDVDGFDLLLWQRAFVADGGAWPVPEPGAAVLAAIGILVSRRHSFRKPISG